MSKERRKRRDEREQFLNVDGLLGSAAAAEGRTIESESEREQFVRELVERGAIVDLGPHPSGHGRKLSFRFDKLNDQPTYRSLDELCEGLLGRKARK